MDRTTKKAITWVVAPVASALVWNIYKGLQPHDSPVPVVFPLLKAASTSSTSAMTVVDRKS
jgi:hypothetical protein